MESFFDSASAYLQPVHPYLSKARVLFTTTYIGFAASLLVGAFLFTFFARCLFCQKKIVKGKSVFITGGSTGIGYSIAEEYVKLGANVCIFARTESKLEAAKEKLLTLRVDDSQIVEYACMDVTSAKSVRRAVDEGRGAIGQPDVLISAAGQAFPGYFLEQKASVFEKTMQLNYMGNIHVIKTVVPHMVAQKSGQICIIASAASVVSFIGYSSYAPTKFAVRGLADSLRTELSGFGIQVSIAYPPDTDTPGFKLENEKKPKETLACFPADPYSSASVAQSVVDGIRMGDYHIQSPDLLQNLLVSSMSGVTPRAYAMLEILLLPIISLVEIPFYMWFDYQARVYADRVLRKDAAVKKDK